MEFHPLRVPGVGAVWQIVATEETALASSRNCNLAGNVEKLSGKFYKGWTKRFVTLREVNLLIYYETENDVSPKGIVMLPKDVVVEIEKDKDKDSTRRIIRITSESGRVITLGVSSESEANDWKAALRSQDTIRLELEGKKQIQAELDALHFTNKKIRSELDDRDVNSHQMSEKLDVLSSWSSSVISYCRTLFQGDTSVVPESVVKSFLNGGILPDGYPKVLPLPPILKANVSDAQWTLNTQIMTYLLMASIDSKMRFTQILALEKANGSLMDRVREVADIVRRVNSQLAEEQEKEKAMRVKWKEREDLFRNTLTKLLDKVHKEKRRNESLISFIQENRIKPVGSEDDPNSPNLEKSFSNLSHSGIHLQGNPSNSSLDTSALRVDELDTPRSRSSSIGDAQEFLDVQTRSRSISQLSRDSQYHSQSSLGRESSEALSMRTSLQQAIEALESQKSVPEREHITAVQRPLNIISSNLRAPGRVYVLAMAVTNLPAELLGGKLGFQQASLQLDLEILGKNHVPFGPGSSDARTVRLRGGTVFQSRTGVCQAIFHQISCLGTVGSIAGATLSVRARATRTLRADTEVGAASVDLSLLADWPAQPHAEWISLHPPSGSTPISSSAGELPVPVVGTYELDVEAPIFNLAHYSTSGGDSSAEQQHTGVASRSASRAPSRSASNINLRAHTPANGPGGMGSKSQANLIEAPSARTKEDQWASPGLPPAPLDGRPALLLQLAYCPLILTRPRIFLLPNDMPPEVVQIPPVQASSAPLPARDTRSTSNARPQPLSASTTVTTTLSAVNAAVTKDSSVPARGSTRYSTPAVTLLASPSSPSPAAVSRTSVSGADDSLKATSTPTGKPEPAEIGSPLTIGGVLQPDNDLQRALQQLSTLKKAFKVLRAENNRVKEENEKLKEILRLNGLNK